MPRDDSDSSLLDDLWESASADAQWHPSLHESTSTEWDPVIIRHTHPARNAKECVRYVLDPKDPNAKTFTFADRRIHFINQMDHAESPDFVEKLVKAVGGQEHRQMIRLRAWAPRDIQQTLLHAFSHWKAFIKTVGPGLSGSKSEVLNRPEAAKTIKWIQNCQTVEQMMATIQRPRLLEHRLSQDNSLVMLALQNAVDKTHLVLECILRQYIPRPTYAFYLFEDTLDILTARLRWDNDLDKHATATQLADLVSLVLTETDKRMHFQPFQSTIYRILYYLPSERLQTWYEQLQDAACYLTPTTELQFASRFAKSQRTKVLSLDILRHLKERNLINVEGPVVLSVSTSILKFTDRELRHPDSGLPTPADIFAALREIGLSPNNFTYAVILRALCIRGNLNTAMEVFEVMKHQGLKPDAFTYAILVNGCRRSDAYETLADIAVEAFRANIRSSIFWNDVLYGIHTLCMKERTPDGVPRSSIFPLNAIFTRVFDAAPLRPFITGRTTEFGQHFVDGGKDASFPGRLRRLQNEISPLPPREVLQPDSHTISIFLLSMIRSFSQPYEVVVFYAHFKNLLQERHPVAERLVKECGTYVYDVILRTLVQWRGTLRVVLDVIRDMMKNAGEDVDDGAGTAGSEHTDSIEGADIVQTPAPSVYTWSILIKGFIRHRQPDKAEQCIDLMRQHGIEPNHVTWNTLAYGYAAMQNIRGMVHSMQRLEAAGFQADDWTMRAFWVLRDKRRAIEVMEKAVEANRPENEKEEQEQGLRYDEQVEHRKNTVLEEDADDTSLDTEPEDRRSYEKDPSIMSEDAFRQRMDQVDHVEEQGESGTSSEEIDAALAQLDPFGNHVPPERYWRRYPKTVERLRGIAPVDDRYIEVYETWKRLRDEGIASVPPSRSLEDVKRMEWEQQSSKAEVRRIV